jgi:hypothetical protein
MNSLVTHVRGLWPRFGLLVLVPFWAIVVVRAAQRALRWDEVLVALVATGLAYGNARTKRLFLGILPIGLVAVLYDAMHGLKDLGLSPERVHVCDLRALEMRWFGVDVGGVRGTVHDYLQAHAVPALDALCAIPYGIFIYVVIGYALYLYRRDYPRLLRFTWCFLALNLTGFVIYHLYPAAPPWYFHSHGCHVDLSTTAHEGPNLARVDAWLGFPYFANFYRRSSDVFGAVPSLHVAYPLLMVIEGFSLHRVLGRVSLIGFYLLMCFSAVYLDHHWICDVVAGSVLTLLTVALVRRAFRSKLGELAPLRLSYGSAPSARRETGDSH